MPISQIGTNGIESGAVVAADIATGAVTQTKIATGVAGTGPAFSAWQSSAQTVTATTFTKMQLQSEEFDTANSFDSTTNYRFQPSVAGYYQVNGGVGFLVVGNNMLASIFKGGNEWKRGNFSNGANAVVSALIYLNGTSDYLELYTYQASAGSLATAGGQSLNYFQASLVRSA